MQEPVNSRVDRRGLQFSIRGFLVLFGIVAALCAFPTAAMLIAWHAHIVAPLAFCLMATYFWFASRRGSHRSASRWPSRRGWLAIFVTSVLVGLSWLAYHRCLHADPETWPLGFPYPDRLIIAVHDWWDRMNPSPEGHGKMYGEAISIAIAIQLLLIGTCAVLGGTCGYAFRGLGPAAGSETRPNNV